MAKIVQLKIGGIDIYPQTTTDAIAVIPDLEVVNKEEKQTN